MFTNWVLRKWFFVFILMVLVNPIELGNLPGPSNTESLQQRKRKAVAECRTCGYKTDNQVISTVMGTHNEFPNLLIIY